MKNKSSWLLSTLLAVAMVFGLFAAFPMTASAADDPFQITQTPQSASYYLGQTPHDLEATFEYAYNSGRGMLSDQADIEVRWYWSYNNLITDSDNCIVTFCVQAFLIIA